MLNALDIDLLMDSRTVDGDGDAITLDRSRHGLHAQLGDGVTPATMPAFDALNGRYTFNIDNYMLILSADDVDDVLADMGSIQDEFYMVYLDPAIWTPATNQTLFAKEGAGGEYVWLRYLVGDTLQFAAYDGAAGEFLTTTVAITALTQGKRMLITAQRALDVQEFWFDDVLVDSDTDASTDNSSDSDLTIGARAGISQHLRNDSGIKFFGYGRGRVTKTWLRQLTRFLGRNL